jgi:hypothetical protein
MTSPGAPAAPLPTPRKTPHMTLRLFVAALGVVLAASACIFPSALAAGKADEPRLAHMVFFTLKDHSSESRAKFVASCNKYLKDHEGAVFFAVGTIAEDVVEGPSVRDFDVALHVLFETKDAEAKYLKHPRHTQFVEENKDQFAKVRVFDSYVPRQP